MNKSPFSAELVEILSKAVSNKIYGSVEVYFENGTITQVTQRIIKKIRSREVHPIDSQNNSISRTPKNVSKETKVANLQTP